MYNKIKLEKPLTQYTSIYSNQIKYLNFRLEKLLEENLGSKILDISHRNIFYNISSWVRKTKEK